MILHHLAIIWSWQGQFVYQTTAKYCAEELVKKQHFLKKICISSFNNRESIWLEYNHWLPDWLTGYSLLGIDYYVRVTSYVDRQSANCFIYIGIGIFSSLLVSLCWWENPLQATNHMQVRLPAFHHFLKEVERQKKIQLFCYSKSLYLS